MNFSPENAAAPESGKLSVKVIGIGGAGVNAIEQMQSSDLAQLPFAAIHTNAARLESSLVARKLLIGTQLVHGLGAGGDHALGKAAAEADINPLTELCGENDLVFLVTGLGGGTGTGAAPVVARLAKEMGALIVAIVTMPFDFEGVRRQRQAQAGLQQLKSAADAVICLPNQKMFKLIDEHTSVREAFTLTNNLLAQAIRGIWQIFSRPGLIQVDFGDLCSVVRGRHAESSFAMAQSQGEARAREVVEKLLASPLLDGGQALVEADSLLVNVSGGPDLTMADINRVMEQLNRHAENAHVIMGAAIEDELQGKLSVTLIASRKGQPAETDRRESSTDAAVPGPEMDTFFNTTAPQRPPSRFVAPPPQLTPETAERLLTQKAVAGSRNRNLSARLRQGQLPLDVISKGRFEKIEPTIHQGQDLDVPTYIRRGVPLN
jgi:cell division protein FtsZ